MRVSNCKRICRQKKTLCSLNSKFDKLVRMSSDKCEVSGSIPLVDRDDKVRVPSACQLW